VDAILESGLRKTVFVDRGNGHFEPRPVETGWRVGDRVEIVQGLAPGDRIAVSGTFLIDSESRMRLPPGGPSGVLSKAKPAQAGDEHAAHSHAEHHP
jgi:Cu(I)/Ag(I) efflux system membrane fusion protein